MAGSAALWRAGMWANLADGWLLCLACPEAPALVVGPLARWPTVLRQSVPRPCYRSRSGWRLLTFRIAACVALPADSRRVVAGRSSRAGGFLRQVRGACWSPESPSVSRTIGGLRCCQQECFCWCEVLALDPYADPTLPPATTRQFQ